MRKAIHDCFQLEAQVEMPSNFVWLWRNRERSAIRQRTVKVWVKRLYHLPGLARLSLRSYVLRCRGAAIDRLVVLGRARIRGDLSKLAIGEQSALGRCEIALHDRVQIGRCVTINDGAVLLTASHAVDDPMWRHKTEPIVIGDFAWIAMNAIVLPGVVVGHGAVVGAGAVVRQDVPDYAIVIGNPAITLARSRIRDLRYSPAALCAAFEAWLGPPREPAKGEFGNET